MKYLTVKDILLLHYLAIENAGGSHGIRDLSLIESAVNRPRASFTGQDLYPTIFEKAAALCRSLIKNHPFVDGNKRTALYATMTFLELNGYKFIAEQEELVKFGVRIDNENLSLAEIAAWFKKHSRKRKI